jgi:hypothetical protein
MKIFNIEVKLCNKKYCRGCPCVDGSMVLAMNLVKIYIVE